MIGPRVALLALVLVGPALAAPSSAGGHWDILGEDGMVWVPDEPPTAAYLPPPDLGAYHNHAELTSALQALAASHPGHVSLASLGNSVEGRAIWAVTLHAGAQDGRPALLFDGAHHGDEVIASEVLLRYTQELADGYPSTSRSRAILENVTLVIVPMVNPDGVARAHSSTNYADARKNAHGVDLNRNYAFHWGGTGSSGSPSDATYRGPSAASEPETQAITALMNSRAWTFYSSLHSGAEMILWPYGWTTTAPPENSLYTTLGNELSAVTGGLPNGQVSRILYAVSGDSMDHAYGGDLPGWRPISVSPETYEGSGNAFDWWFLFNPPEGEIVSVSATWRAFLDHLAAEAPHYAPATLGVTGGPTGVGAEPFGVTATLTPSAKRPVLGASALASPPPFLSVLTANPVGLGNVAAPASASWTLQPASGGTGDLRVVVDGTIAGKLTHTIPVQVIAPGITLVLDRARAGSGETVNATVTVTTSAALEGEATITWLGAAVDARPVSLAEGASASYVVALPVGAAPAGAQQALATLAYTTGDATGSVAAAAAVTVDRPQLTVTRSAPATVRPGEPFLMNVSVRNVGNLAARSVHVSEVLPSGYALAPREVGVPVPADPVARPAPRNVTLTDEGRIALHWESVGINPGGAFAYQLRIVALEPGAHALETQLAYAANYPGRSYAYEEQQTSPQTASIT